MTTEEIQFELARIQGLIDYAYERLDAIREKIKDEQVPPKER